MPETMRERIAQLDRIIEKLEKARRVQREAIAQAVLALSAVDPRSRRAMIDAAKAGD